MTDDRAERLAAQLRANLRRRKAQSRARKDDAAPERDDGADREPPERAEEH